LFFYFFLIPWVWHFFLSFSKKNETLVFFYMEPKAFEYFVFFFNFLLFFNCVCLLSFVLFYYFFRFREIFLLLKYKSFCYLFFLLVATLLTPPDFFTQLIMFGGLALIFEVSLCFYVLIFLYLKFNHVS
jgi:sec-independent protein translocase protein TatC